MYYGRRAHCIYRKFTSEIKVWISNVLQANLICNFHVCSGAVNNTQIVSLCSSGIMFDASQCFLIHTDTYPSYDNKASAFCDCLKIAVIRHAYNHKSSMDLVDKTTRWSSFRQNLFIEKYIFMHVMIFPTLSKWQIDERTIKLFFA